MNYSAYIRSLAREDMKQYARLCMNAKRKSIGYQPRRPSSFGYMTAYRIWRAIDLIHRNG